jgi:membrane-bound lytic murein transglycosylase D
LAGLGPADPSPAVISVDTTETVDAGAAESISSATGIQQQLDEALDFCEAAQNFWQNGELENALESLDRAYSLILTVEPDDPAKLVQQKEDLRFLISKRILEIYASRNIVVNGNHNAIPRELNTNIQKEINLFTKGPERRFFIDSFKRSGKYRPYDPEKIGGGRSSRRVILAAADRERFQGEGPFPRPGAGTLAVYSLNGLQVRLKRDQYIDERIDFENQAMPPSPT